MRWIRLRDTGRRKHSIPVFYPLPIEPSEALTRNALVMNCDSDHTENPAEWITPEKLDEMMPDMPL